MTIEEIKQRNAELKVAHPDYIIAMWTKENIYLFEDDAILYLKVSFTGELTEEDNEVESISFPRTKNNAWIFKKLELIGKVILHCVL